MFCAGEACQGLANKHRLTREQMLNSLCEDPSDLVTLNRLCYKLCFDPHLPEDHAALPYAYMPFSLVHTHKNQTARV